MRRLIFVIFFDTINWQAGPKSELKSLYRQRWHVELNFRNREDHGGPEDTRQQEPSHGDQGDLGTPVGLQLRPSNDAASCRHRGCVTAPIDFQAHAATLHGLPALFDPPRSRCRTSFAASHRQPAHRTTVWARRTTRDQTKTQIHSTTDQSPTPRARRTTTSWTSLRLKSVPFGTEEIIRT